jgi:hypothetical protein
MDAAKDILAMPFVSNLLKWEYWPYYLAVFIALALLMALLFLVMRRRSRFAFGGADIRKHMAAGLPDRKDQIPRSSLVKVWKRFLGQIPRQFRRAIQTYQPFIVLGESGSGKSLLIDNNTDWRGQANRFYPSYTVDPLLQIHLGSRALVMEIPAPLLNNTSRQARNALLKLWKPLFRDREATVVVVLNAAAMPQELPENIRRYAQTVRGKINILSAVRNKPVRVCVALTHMDQVEGYAELAGFLRKENIPLDITLHSNTDVERLSSSLEPYEALLPRVLTSVSSDDYLRTLSFFRKAPEILSVLSSFVKVLQSPDPLSSAPLMSHVCFTSRGSSEDAPGSNPFVPDQPVERARKTIPNLRHRIAAALLLALAILYLGGVYYGERYTLIKADEILNQIEASPLREYNEYTHGLFMKVSMDIEESLAMLLPPAFFPKAQEYVRGNFVESIRKFYLLPSFMNVGTGEDAQEKGIYLLGLIYSTKHNDLGKLVLANTNEWHKALHLPNFLITDYVQNNEGIDDIAVDVSRLPMGRSKGVGPMDNPLSWVLFFRNVKKAIEEPAISKEYLHSLQKQADSFLGIVETISRYRLTNELVSLLKLHTPVGSQIQWVQRRDALLEQEDLRELLLKIKERDINYPSVIGLGLTEFIENLEVMAKLSASEEDKEYRIVDSGETFVYTAQGWNSLIMRSRMTLFMREFLAQNRRTDGLLFFGKASSIGYPDLQMNPSNDGLLFFIGKGKVDGRLTRSGFEQEVKPVLTDLDETLQGLPIAAEEKKRFSGFIAKQAEAYADRYVAAYRSYYSQFHLAADSQGGLRYLLKQIQLPTSPFQDFLSSMKENTALDVGESPFLRQFAKKLGTFEFIRRLMAEKDGAFPEYDKYKAILRQMDDELDSGEPFTVKNKADDAGELKRILSPLGRISLAIQRGENDSYAGMVRSWIKSVGMDPEWQGPFLDPVMIAFFLGRSDVELSIQKVWSDLSESYVKPLYSKFPFNQKTETEIPPPEIERIFHPQGTFWKSFRDYIAPVCQENSGFWSERVSPQGTFRIPDDMLDRANELSGLTSVLWNEKGVAQPLTLQIRPAGLPPRAEHAPLAVLSYLRSDKSSVFAFNQQPAWQKLEIEWWKQQTSAVGVEFEAYPGSGKSYREISIPERFWSFYHLLHKGELINRNVLVWRIAGPASPEQQVRIEFTLKSDPWAAFRLDRW